jgi:Mn-dependent DtxR family transcriptional regulator
LFYICRAASLKIIPKNIAPEILRERDREGVEGRKYRINRTAPAVLVFMQLKNLSKTGFIKYNDLEKRTAFFKRIAKELNISPNTLAKRLSKLSTLKLVEHIEGKFIKLSSWKKLCSLFCVANDGFHQVSELNTETLYKLLIQEKKAAMKKAVVNKYRDLVTKYPNLLDQYTTGEMSAAKLDEIQKYIFVNGTEHGKDFIDLVFSVNPRLEMSCLGWRLELFHKKPSSVFYWLKKLVASKSIVYRRGCVLQSNKNVHLKFSKWNKLTKKTIWPLTGSITLETPVN